MRVATGVVVQVQRGEGAALHHAPVHRRHQPCFGHLGQVRFGAGPHAVVVGLAFEPAQALFGGSDIAHHQHKAARQRAIPIAGQHALHRAKAGILVAVHQDGYEQRCLALARQFDQRRSGQQPVQVARAGLQEAFGQAVHDRQLGRGHGRDTHSGHS